MVQVVKIDVLQVSETEKIGDIGNIDIINISRQVISVSLMLFSGVQRGIY